MNKKSKKRKKKCIKVCYRTIIIILIKDLTFSSTRRERLMYIRKGYIRYGQVSVANNDERKRGRDIIKRLELFLINHNKIFIIYNFFYC